eukprot:TRINITY_DN19661_c0_g1_i1.p1 TRINITY_DN19661_c0_g1~~TRINITY_DN19661_c0_g1_i1.p1  ORF type:complete len:201 (+),score=31.47 TRINITY_DN19661_c0_g1_i1:223-825(+)
MSVAGTPRLAAITACTFWANSTEFSCSSWEGWYTGKNSRVTLLIGLAMMSRMEWMNLWSWSPGPRGEVVSAVPDGDGLNRLPRFEPSSLEADQGLAIGSGALCEYEYLRPGQGGAGSGYDGLSCTSSAGHAAPVYKDGVAHCLGSPQYRCTPILHPRHRAARAQGYREHVQEGAVRRHYQYGAVLRGACCPTIFTLNPRA